MRSLILTHFSPFQRASFNLGRPAIWQARSLHKAPSTSRQRRPAAYTWLTSTPQAISQEDIFSTFVDPLFDGTEDAPPNLLPLVLVTPGFAHWIDTANPFLENLVSKIASEGPVSRQAPFHYAVAAVVDKIADPTGVGHTRLRAQHGDTVSAFGEYEGLSLLVVQPHEVQWMATPTRRIGSPAGEEPCLAISIQSAMSKAGAQGAVSRGFGLRLAQTVFTNGKDRTLLGMRFAAKERKTHACSYSMDKSMDLSSCIVAVKSSNCDIRPTFPLDAITPQRRVLSSMGNILRQVASSSDPDSSVPMPASQELEKELPRYLDEHKIADQRVSVWALVEKPNLEPCESTSSQERVRRSLEQGGKLHRVMSGGGGWGKKQGLLSLDPEVGFAGLFDCDDPINLDCIFDPTVKTQIDTPFPLEVEMAGDDLSHLSQVAGAGDLIQFYVSTSPSHSTVPETKSGVTYCFGVVSQSDDSGSMQDVEHGQKNFVAVPNMFGALSEKAIAYYQPVSHRTEGQLTSTKLDIPASRVIILPGDH